MSSFERSRGKRSNLNFERTARAFDESAVPAHNLAAKKEVKAAKRPDLLLAGRPGWNQSTLSENMKRFPDRPLCRQNFKYDAPKRADYNFRAEVLEHADRAMYMPRESKFEYSERRVTAPGLQLANPPPLSRVEFPNHPELARATASGEKKRWDGATGAGGDPYAAQCAHEARGQKMLEAALANGKKHPPRRRETLYERETRHQAELRERKATRRRLESMGITPAPWQEAGPPLSAEDQLELSRQVPARKTTTWSLGSF